MRKLIMAAAIAAGLTLGGPALANPPEDDPTCDRADCAGDNGNQGCEGLDEARNYTPGEADPAVDLVESILGGDDCES